MKKTRCRYPVPCFCAWELSATASASDFPTGDFCPGVASRLGSEIVRPRMDDDRFPDDLSHGEAIREKNLKGSAAITKQGRQVTGMMRMETVLWIVMALCICERITFISRALSAAMDMECEKWTLTFPGRNRKPCDVSKHKHAIGRLIKPYLTANACVLLTALDVCNSVWPLHQDGDISLQRDIPAMISSHKYPPSIWIVHRLCNWKGRGEKETRTFVRASGVIELCLMLQFVL